MKKTRGTWILMVALAMAFSIAQNGAAADAMNTEYGGEPYLIEDGTIAGPADSIFGRRGKIAAAVALVVLLLVILYWKPRRLKPGSYRFYPSERTARRPRSLFRR